ncbi:hypothetical protein F4778DRAFT_733217 [Xylariomycetidae sp. FL2044]|nr:hypothetical protein F4778DRAFT_733217 [Xylariomycetidae sp. FL2044]
MTTTPPGLSTTTGSNSDWTTNTWITTTDSEGSSTVVPVLVGCPGCGGDGKGIVLWNLPTTTGVSFNLPNLPTFSLPCIQVLGMSVGSCPGPETSSEDDGGSDDDPSSTEENTSTTTTSTSSECTKTQTVSDCEVLCKPTTSSTFTSVTCYTTVCSQTTAGCSVTGTTTTTTSTSSCSASPSGVGRRGDSCGGGCPSYDVPYESLSDSDEDEDEGVIEKKEILARAPKNVAQFAGCVLATPVQKPITVPSNPPGKKFWQQDKIGFKNAKGDAKVASMAVPRWYSTTVSPAACTPEVVKVDVANYPDGPTDTSNQDKAKVAQRATIDHSWEKGWLTDFFDSIIDDSATVLADASDAGSGKMTCDDFNKYIFDSGNENFIADLYTGLPSKEPANLDFIGMTDNLNANCKGAVSNPSLHLKNIPRVIALDVDGDVETALSNMNQKLGQLERIRLGVYMTNMDDNQQVADTTNNRLHTLMQQLDKDLAAKYPDVAAFQDTWFFTRQFQTFMDSLVADEPDTVRRTVKDHASNLVDDITSKMSTLNGRDDELTEKAADDWSQMKTKWSYYKGLDSSTWDMNLSWSWGCGRKRDGSGSACELHSPSSSTSTASQTGTSSAGASKTSNTATTTSSSTPVSTTSTGTKTHSITSTFVTSTRSNTCTYETPVLTGGQSPYCTYHADPHNSGESYCQCEDSKTYAPYTKSDVCQPVCPLTSPAKGYSQITADPTTTTTEFQSFTTTDVVGNVQVCTSLSAIGNGIPGSKCIGPTLHTEVTIETTTPTPTPTTTLLPQGQKTCYSGAQLRFNRDDVQSKIQHICRQTQYWKGVDEVWTDGSVQRYDGVEDEETDEGKVSVLVMEVERACPSGSDVDSQIESNKLNSDVCEDNLMTAVDGCDTDDGERKHGGIVWANCFSWEVRVDPR